MYKLARIVPADDNVLRGRDQAVLNTPVAAQSLLVGTRMEHTHVQVLAFFNLRQVHLRGVGFGIVEVLAVAGQATKVYFLKAVVPVVNG